MVQWGDIPTWVTAGVAFLALIGATLAYRTQSEQLRLQRIQFEDQTRIQEREQANLVDVSVRSIDGAETKVLPEGKGEPVHMIVVTNRSKRPIRTITVLMDIDRVTAVIDKSQRKLADVKGTLEPYAIGTNAVGETFVPMEPGMKGTVDLLRAGQTAAFVWSFFTVARFPRVIWWVMFNDDAGLIWQIDNSLHLQRIEDWRSHR